MADYVVRADYPLTAFAAAFGSPSPSSSVAAAAAGPLTPFAIALDGGTARYSPAMGIVTAAGVNSAAIVRHVGHRLQWELAGPELLSLSWQGAPDGVRIVAVGGLCGPGFGSIKLWNEGTPAPITDGAGPGGSGPGGGVGVGRPNRMAWRAPGSNTYGPAVDPTIDDMWTLEDGGDPDKWIRVGVSTLRTAAGGGAAGVRLGDAFATGLDGGDVSAVQAAAGNVATVALTLRNLSAGYDLTLVTVWVDDTTADTWELSWDNVSYFAPRTEAAALAGLGTKTIIGSGTQALYARRTITAGAGSQAKRSLILRASFDDACGGRARSMARSLYRIFNATEYRIYRKAGGEPRMGVDSVFAANATLPYSPAGTFANDTWFLGVSKFNGVLESDFAPQGHRLKVTTGQQDALPPLDPVIVQVRQIAGGAVRIVAIYNPLRDGDTGTQADQWAVWYTTNGSAPATSGSPQYTEALAYDATGHARLVYDLPGQADATTVRVVVRVRRSTVSGVGGLIPTSQTAEATAVVIELSGPPAAAGASGIPGRAGT